MRRRLGGHPRAGHLGAAQMLDRLAGGQVHQVHGLAGVGGEIDVARDHQALAERGPAAEPELGRDLAGVGVAATRQRLLLAVHGDHPPGDGVVLECAPHHARRLPPDGRRR